MYMCKFRLNCLNSVKLDHYEHSTKLSQFLMRLNDQFTNTSGQILLMNPLPELANAYAMLLQEETQ